MHTQHACDRLPTFFKYYYWETNKQKKSPIFVLSSGRRRKQRVGGVGAFNFFEMWFQPTFVTIQHRTLVSFLPPPFLLLKYINGSFVCCVRKTSERAPPWWLDGVFFFWKYNFCLFFPPNWSNYADGFCCVASPLSLSFGFYLKLK